MTPLGGIVGFIVHALLVWLAAAIAKVEKATFWKAVGVAIIGFVLVALFGLLAWPLKLIPILGGLIAAIIAFIATSIAAKLVFDCRWETAWTIALVVAIAQLVLRWVLP